MRSLRVATLAPVVLAAGCSFILSFDESSSGDGGAGGDAVGEPGGDGGTRLDACTPGAVTSSPVDPTLIVALDSSGSMGSSLDVNGAASRLELAIGTVRERLATRYAHVRVGAVTFSGAGAGGCPTAASSPPALDASAATDGVFATAAPNGQAPFVEGIARAAALAGATPVPGVGRILFITDSPVVDCSTTANVPGAIEAARAATTLGLGLDLIALGPDLPDADAAAIASAGNGTAARVLEVEELSPTIERSLVALDSCLFRPDDGGPADATAIFLDGQEVPAGAWDVDATGAVRLLGDVCATYLAGTRRSIQVVRGCG